MVILLARLISAGTNQPLFIANHGMNGGQEIRLDDSGDLPLVLVAPLEGNASWRAEPYAPLYAAAQLYLQVMVALLAPWRL